MKKLSISFGVTLRKIDNWFKHKRRTDVKKGNMDFSVSYIHTMNKLQFYFYFLAEEVFFKK